MTACAQRTGGLTIVSIFVLCCTLASMALPQMSFYTRSPPDAGGLSLLTSYDVYVFEACFGQELLRSGVSQGVRVSRTCNRSDGAGVTGRWRLAQWCAVLCLCTSLVVGGMSHCAASSRGLTSLRHRLAALAGAALVVMFAVMTGVVADERQSPVMFTAGVVLEKSKFGHGFWFTVLGIPVSACICAAISGRDDASTYRTNSAEDLGQAGMDSGLELANTSSSSKKRPHGKIVV